MDNLFVAKNENKRLLYIKELYNNGDFEIALREVNFYLLLYPNDLIAIYYLGKIYRMLKMFDKSKETFIELLPRISSNNEYNIKILVELIYLEIYRKDYLAALSYLKRVEKISGFRVIKNLNIELTKMFLLNQLGMIKENKVVNKNKYFEQQIIEYDENKFMNRLLMNNLSNHDNDANYREFQTDIDLKDLYTDILNVISLAKRTPTYNVFDTYYFYYPEAGFDKDGILDYIQVLTYTDNEGNICILEISPYRIDKYKNYINDIVDLEYQKYDLEDEMKLKREV